MNSTQSKYIHLLHRVVRLTDWDAPEDKIKSNRGRKPKQIKSILDINNPRNKNIIRK